LAFRRLLDLYYTSEKPIPNKTQEVSRRIRLTNNEVDVLSVLQEFFSFDEERDCWFHKRCDKAIADYQAKAERNRAVGKLGGRPKSNPDAIPKETQTVSKDNPNHKPITNNHKPIDIEANASLSADKLPDCPHKEILILYKKHLSHLSQPRVWEGSRQANLRQRWKQAAKPSNYSPDGYKTMEAGLKWWDSFFAYVANDTKLANGFQTKDRTWLPDLEWIVNATNFAKIIDGKYAK